MSLYMSTNKAWIPVSTEPMSDVLAAVLVPHNQDQIPSFSEYLELLAMRVEWMIQQEEQSEAWQMVNHYIKRGGMYYEVSNWLERDEPPDKWALALTEGNPYFQEKLNYALETNFPVTVTENMEALGIIERTPLSEWLQLMAHEPRED